MESAKSGDWNMSAPLSKGQKSYLAQLARQAWRRECENARVRGEDVDASAGAAQNYRHRAVIEACGKHGLRCCGQDDYGLVKGALLERLGAHGAAFKAMVRQQTNGVRVAQAVLLRELANAELQVGYAAAICMRQYRCALEDAGEKQLWSLVFTVRNRARGRAMKSRENEQKERNKKCIA